MDGQMADLAAALRIALRAEGVARQSDLREIKEQLGEHSRAIDELKAEMAAVRSERTTSAAASSSWPSLPGTPGRLVGGLPAFRPPQHRFQQQPQQQQQPSPQQQPQQPYRQQQWRPTTLLLRGWAPYGSDPKAKITKIEYMQIAKKLENAIGDEYKRHIQVPAPYALSYQIMVRLVDVNDLQAATIKARIEQWIEEDSIKVKGTRPRVAWETSPLRRRMVAEYFAARAALAAKGVDMEREVLLCDRGLKIYSAESLAIVGECSAAGSWVWTPEADKFDRGGGEEDAEGGEEDNKKKQRKRKAGQAEARAKASTEPNDEEEDDDDKMEEAKATQKEESPDAQVPGEEEGAQE